MQVEVNVSPEQMATEFWEACSTKQACFFNQLARIVNDELKFETQLSFVVADEVLNPEALRLMQIIGRTAADKVK